MTQTMNKLFTGDNLDILREIPDASIDLIATDPPFNTGKDWGAFSDKWGGIKSYIKFMEARCVEMRRVLKDTGSFYLHCDPHSSHYLKVMLDDVFGIKQFRNEIVWQYSKMGTARQCFRRKHDIVLYYVVSNKNAIFNMVLEPATDRMKKDWQIGYHSHGDWLTVYDRNKPKAQKQINSGRYKNICYTENLKGKIAGDIWNIYAIGSTAKERLNYPTQKPVALYQRIIKASSNQGDVVLDPFAGSGTTLDAAHTLGRQWIGIDSGEQAIETIIERLRNRHGLEYDRDYQIINAAAATEPATSSTPPSKAIDSR